MKFTKKDLKPIIVLGVICIVVAVLIAGINMITAPEIERREEIAVQDSLKAVMPDGSFVLATEKYDIKDTTVTAVYENVNPETEKVEGWVVTLSTSKGYTGNAILLTIGIDSEGHVTGAVVTSNPESKETNKTDSYFGKFKDKNPMEIDKMGKDQPDLVAGVTYSTAAVREAAMDAYRVLNIPNVEIPKAEAKEPVGEYTVWSTVGICIIVAAIGSAVAYIIVKRRKGI